MYEIVTDIPKMNDATSMYRAASPLGALRQQARKIQYRQLREYHPITLSMFDGMFMQRPYAKSHAGTVEMVKDCNMRLWVDYDDNLFAVPSDNPTFHIYEKPDIKKNVSRIVEVADVITVTTNELARVLLKANKNVHVVPNAFNDLTMLHMRPKKMPPRQPVVCWRGSRTHTRDVMAFTPEIIETSRNPIFKEWVWNFIGDNCWYATDFMPHEKTIWHEGVDPYTYHRHLLTIAPSVMIVPLSDSVFNRSKSNIAWIEASFAGAVTLAPDWEEWKRPGILNYKDPEQFKELLEGVLSNQFDIQKMAGESWEYICDNLFLSKVTVKRLKVASELLGVEVDQLR